MDSNLIISRLKNYSNFETDKELYEFLGVKSSTFGNWRARNVVDYELILSKFSHIDLNWLFRGEKLEQCSCTAARQRNDDFNIEKADFYKREYERKCAELDQANARLDRLIDKIGCVQYNDSGNNINNSK